MAPNISARSSDFARPGNERRRDLSEEWDAASGITATNFSIINSQNYQSIVIILTAMHGNSRVRLGDSATISD
jgi:hypothetical protein